MSGLPPHSPAPVTGTLMRPWFRARIFLAPCTWVAMAPLRTLPGRDRALFRRPGRAGCSAQPSLSPLLEPLRFEPLRLEPLRLELLRRGSLDAPLAWERATALGPGA